MKSLNYLKKKLNFLDFNPFKITLSKIKFIGKTTD